MLDTNSGYGKVVLEGQPDMRITVQVLNGATGEVREIVAKVEATNEQNAVDKLMSIARKDDYYYRFLGHSRIINPTKGTELVHNNMIYWSAE